MSPEGLNGYVTTNTVKWGVGVAVTIIIALILSLISAGAARAERAAKQQVLENQVHNLENTISTVTTLVQQIHSTVAQMKADQAAHQAEMRVTITNFKEDLQDIQRREPPGP